MSLNGKTMPVSTEECSTEGCLDDILWQWWEQCIQHSRHLEMTGCAWHICHIYRLYNQVADQLANKGIEDRTPGSITTVVK